MDWEKILKEAADKGLITIGGCKKSGDILLSLLSEQTRKAGLWALLSSPNYCTRDLVDWKDLLQAVKN